jgi:triphosphoribosyl-dephospho-CoA synthase
MLSLGVCAQLACIWEATARKPGNVHRYCDFEDTTYIDFLASAAATGPILGTASRRPVGETILQAAEATRQVAATNTNLGIVLLLAPLAAVPASEALSLGLPQTLGRLDIEDARNAYRAIRLAAPGGLGQVSQQDVAQEPTVTLREAMRLAADRDRIALQYVNDFADVRETGLAGLGLGLRATGYLEGAIIYCHLHLLAAFPDSLIARNRGWDEAGEASRRAGAILDANWPHTDRARVALKTFDDWLRVDGHGRNPGTTADLVTASLFVSLREGIIKPPVQFGPPAESWSGVP